MDRLLNLIMFTIIIFAGLLGISLWQSRPGIKEFFEPGIDAFKRGIYGPDYDVPEAEKWPGYHDDYEYPHGIGHA